MILDTNVIIDLLRGERNIINKIRDLEKKNITILLTSISVFEIWQGLNDMVDLKKLEKIQFLLDSICTFYFDTSTAKEAGHIYALLRRNGQIIDPEDSMIAGIAKFHREPILTKNTKHFERINGLKIETY